MGMPKVDYKVGRTRTNNDPNTISNIRFGGTPKSIFKKVKPSKPSAPNEPFTFTEWMMIITVLIPLTILFIIAFPKFFMWLGIILVCSLFFIWAFSVISRK